MSRRRKKNPLLMRIIVVSLAVHAIALPIAAHYGAFQKIQQEFGPAKVVLLPAPAEEKEKPKEAEKQKKEHAKPTAAKKGPAQRRSTQAVKPNPYAPKIVTSGAGEAGGDSATAVSGNGRAGEIPVTPTATKPPPPPPPVTRTVTTTPAPPPPVETLPKTSTTTVTPAPAKAPAFVEADTTDSPQPEIPDDLRSDPLDKTWVGLFVVGPDGRPTSVTMVQSTGIQELDDVALAAAKRWRFRAATLGGAPVESKVRLHIQFQVQ
jgi:protein TonB